MRTHILFFILIIELSIIGSLSVEAFGAHGDNPNHHYHPTLELYDHFELTLITVWVQAQDLSDTNPCNINQRLNSLGVCTDWRLHYDIFPLRLMQITPCPDMQGCVIQNQYDFGIYITNGRQGKLPMYGGCSVLKHEIAHLEYHIIFGGHSDEVEEHMWIQKTYPNSECSVKRHSIF